MLFYSATNNYKLGLPDIVENISYTSNCSFITLVWDPVGPQLTYSIEVYNITEEESGINITPVETYNETEPMLVFTSTALVSGYLSLEFVVIAVSQMGRGPPSSPITIRENFTCGNRKSSQ